MISEQVPLVVDLDGTLVCTDLLWESMLLAVKLKPSLLFALLFWLVQGKAHLKRKLAERVKINAGTLPYRTDVMTFLEGERNLGRKIILAAGSDRQLVQPIARHLGVFDDVIASDGEFNVKGIKKRKILETASAFESLTISVATWPIWLSGSRRMWRYLSSHLSRS